MRIAVAMVGLVASVSAFAAEPPSVAVVSRLYRDFAWEAVLARPNVPALAEQPRAVLLRYFTPELASALAADAACVSRHHEICALDFMPLWDSQDPAATGLAVAAAGPGLVGVTFKTPSSARPVTLQMKVVATKAGWRVADILYPSGASLSQQLSGPAK